MPGERNGHVGFARAMEGGPWQACGVRSSAAAIEMNPGALSAELPRLLYVGDVPVECSYHGSALLYRLLQKYPVDRLRIIEAGLQASRPDRRLKAVSYCHLPGFRIRGLAVGTAQPIWFWPQAGWRKSKP